LHHDLVAAAMVAPAWDLIFIVDFTLTRFPCAAIARWAYAHPEK